MRTLLSIRFFGMQLNCWAALIVLFSGTSAFAQGVKGTFIGTVRDTTGAVVPGAEIMVKNLETGVVVTGTTNNAGQYVVPFLNSGTYRVEASQKGFSTAVQPSVKLDVAAKVRVDFALQLGQEMQTVEVSGAAPLLETDTTTVSTVMSAQALEQLPLLDRNYQALAGLNPTAVDPTPSLMGNLVRGLSVGNYYQVAGQRGAAIAYSIDGIASNNPFYQWQSIIPSVDTIEEFKTQTHNFSAEFGDGTVQFTTTTKAGTNQFHRSLYEYNQNQHLSADGYFQKRAGQPKNVFTHNQFGATIGGPVLLPKLYDGHDKTFFFFGYQGTRYHSSSSASGRFPDPAWLTGDFSSLGVPIYDPLTTRPDPANPGKFIRDPFPGNIIPSNRITQNAKAALPAFLAPNATPGSLPGNNNYSGSINPGSTVNYWTARVDHNFSERDHLYGRYMQSREKFSAPALTPVSSENTFNKDYNAMIAESHTFSPTVFNEVRVGFNRSNYATLQVGAGGTDYVHDVFNFQNIGGGPITYGYPLLQFTGYTSIGPGGNDPLGALVNGYQITETLAISHGHHMLKMGFDFRPQRFNTIFGTGNRGQFTFNGQFTQAPGNAKTGSPFADFLLGDSSQAIGLAGEASGVFNSNLYAGFFQDDWRVTSRLTLNLGIRYEYYAPWTERNGKNSSFLFGSPIGSCFENTNPCPPGTIFQPKPGQPIYHTDRNNFAPRIGLAYSLGAKRDTVIRAAYGIFYTPLEVTEDVNNLMNAPNTFRFTFLPDNPYTDLTTTQWNNLFPPTGFAAGTVLQTGPNWGNLPPLQVFTPVDPWHTATVNQWQLSVQREVVHNLMVELGYVGSHGYHFQRVVNGNQAILDKPGQTTSVLSRTPYPQLGAFMRAIEHNSINSYNAGTVRVERRFEKGLSILAAYTFAKTIDDYGNTNDFSGFAPQYTYDLKAEKGLSGFDARHRFTIGYVWDIPVGRGRLLGSNTHPVLDGIIGGWQLSGETTMQSGHPLKVAVPSDTSNTGTLATFLRPDQSGSVHYMDPHANNLQYFDPSAFQLPALGTLGNSGRGALIGPGFDNWNITVGKYFHLYEQARLQFRLEMYNAFNHTQFDGVNTTLNNPAMGQVTSTRDPRQMQLALRFEF